MQQRGADKVRGIARAELSHRLGAMAFESSRADAHPQGALLVGAPFTDEVQNLALALRQRLLTRLRCEHDARRAVLGPAGTHFPASRAAWHGDGFFLRTGN